MSEGNTSIADLRAKLNQNGGFLPKIPVIKKEAPLAIDEHLALSRAPGPKGRRPPTKYKVNELLTSSDLEKSVSTKESKVEKIVEPKTEESKTKETKAEEAKAKEPKADEAEAEQPKTEEPKTEEPKSEQPKTEESKSEQPKSEEPKTEEPKAEEPKTEQPKFEEPKTEEVKTEDQKGEESKTEQPKIGEDKTKEPKGEEPKTEESKSEQPKSEELKTEEPRAEEPKTEELKTEEPEIVILPTEQEKLDLDHARKRSDTRFLGHVDKEANQRRSSMVELDSIRVSTGRRSIVGADTKDAESIHREISNRMHQAQRIQMEKLQSLLHPHGGTSSNASISVSKRRSQQALLGAMSSAVNMLPQNVDAKALGKKNLLSSMDLRSLRVALRATWRRLHHLQGSLASAVVHADSTLSEYDKMKTTLPEVLEQQQLASLFEGDEGDQRRTSDNIDQAAKEAADQKKRRRKSVAATRTMLGQAITDFTSQLKETKNGKGIADALDTLFTSFGVEGTGHRPLPSHQASRILEALVAAGKRIKKLDIEGLVIDALFRIIPILRDPDEALELELWLCGDESEDSPRRRDAPIWRASLELLAGSDQTMSCFKDGDFLSRLKAMAALISDTELNRKESAKLASKAQVGIRVEGGKRQQLDLAMSRILEQATSECETIRTVHGAAEALATATKNRLVAAESPLATPKAIGDLLNRSTPSVAACCEIEKKQAKRMLGSHSEKMMTVLAQRIKFADGLVLFAATASNQAEEASREIARINKVGKQCINAEAEFESWRKGTGGLAEIAANNTNMISELLDKRKNTGDNALGVSDLVVESVNPIFKQMSKSSSLMETRGGSVSEGRVGFGAQKVRQETKVQEQRRTSLMVAQLLFLRDHNSAVERRKALEEERKRAAMIRDSDDSDDSDDSGRNNMMKNITVRKKKVAMDALMAENSDEDNEDEEDEEMHQASEEEKESEESESESDVDSIESDDVSMGDLYGAEDKEEEEAFVSHKNPHTSIREAAETSHPSSSPSSASETVELMKESLRPPRRLRFKDMTGAMRRRLGTALREGGGHFVFGGSKRAGLRIETPVDALRSTEKEKNTMGSRRICGEEWISSPTGAGGRGVGSLSRLSVSVSRVTSSMVRPDAISPSLSKAELMKLKNAKQSN